MSLFEITVNKYLEINIIIFLLFIHLINDIYGQDYDIVIIICKIVAHFSVNDIFIILNDLLSLIFDLSTLLMENNNTLDGLYCYSSIN